MDTWILHTLLVCFLWNFISASKSNAPETNCPTYLSEGEDLNCTCHPPSKDTGCKTFWRGHPDGPLLKKVNVRREDNGTRFTCETDCSGQKSSTDYTLQVAYGPSESSVTVRGPASFLADGNTPMELTCVPGDVNPAPSFKWRNNAGLQCVNDDTENTCFLKPKYFHHGQSVSCKVTNEATDIGVTADFTLNLTYPPPTVPEIITHQLIKPGDTLHCTVNGGKPMVSEINIKYKDQPLPCNRLVRDESSVTCQWNLDVNITDMDEVEFSCSAVWEPDPELYAHVTKDTITVQKPPQGQRESSRHGAGTGSIVGLIIGIASMLIIVTVISSFVIRRKPRRRSSGHNKKNVKQLLPNTFDRMANCVSSNEEPRTEDAKTVDFSARDSVEVEPSSSDKFILEGDVDEPVRKSGNYSTVQDAIRIGVKTSVNVSVHDTSTGYTEVQIDTPSAEPEPPVLIASPYDVDISQLDLSRPEVCHTVGHSSSFQNILSPPTPRGPLGVYYSRVDKKKGLCLLMVHEDNNENLTDTVKADHECNTEVDKMMKAQADGCDDGTYEKLHYDPKPKLLVEKPEHVYSHTDRNLHPHYPVTEISA